jgi:hypothetical protein
MTSTNQITLKFLYENIYNELKLVQSLTINRCSDKWGRKYIQVVHKWEGEKTWYYYYSNVSYLKEYLWLLISNHYHRTMSLTGEVSKEEHEYTCFNQHDADYFIDVMVADIKKMIGDEGLEKRI